MIKLKRDSLSMEVCTMLQASAFQKAGYVIVTEENKHEGQKEIETSNEDKEQKSNQIKYKKSDIDRMNLENLKNLAKELELEVSEESTGRELKKKIIAKLGL